jgi:hypothetical protein
MHTNFDAHLAGQLNRRDAEEETARQEGNAENYREMQKEQQRLDTMIADLAYCKAGEFLDKAAEIAEVARLIASYADAMQ